MSHHDPSRTLFIEHHFVEAPNRTVTVVMAQGELKAKQFWESEKKDWNCKADPKSTAKVHIICKSDTGIKSEIMLDCLIHDSRKKRLQFMFGPKHSNSKFIYLWCE